MNTKIFSVLLLVTTFCISIAQKKRPSDFFDSQRAKIMVFGTFHMDYPNLDAIKTAESDKIDVLSPQKAKEMDEIVASIKKFNPTKIAIEAFPSWNANKKFDEYKKGKYKNQRDERFQLGMRIASELNLPEIYSVDASSIINDLGERFGRTDSLYFKTLTQDYDFLSDDEITKKYLNFYKSSEAKNSTLKEILLYMNSEEYHQYDYGAYLTGDFKLREFDGADMLAIYWYDRNLRIFRNLQRITTNKQDRILVIMGNSHAAVLRHLINSSPEYEWVEVSDYLTK